MSIIFFDGFDYYNGFGPGGRKWDQGSGASVTGGRFGGQAMQPNPYVFKTFSHSYRSLIVGWAMRVDAFQSGWFGTFQPPNHPFVIFSDGANAQFSLWFNPVTFCIEFRTTTGENVNDQILYQTTFPPPFTLWYYIEVKFDVPTGSFDIHINGSSIATGSIQLQQTGNASVSRLGFKVTNDGSGGVQWGMWLCDDLYVIDPTDATNNIDFLGECRIQTKYPDADGYQDDFLRSTGLVNANNVNTVPVTFNDTGAYNYSGTVGAIDLYSIQNFTVSGTIFAVQENMSYKKDDVGNRKVAPILRTAAANYIGSNFSCFSNYTYGNALWENNPATGQPWDLTDLNLTEFGITVTA